MNVILLKKILYDVVGSANFGVVNFRRNGNKCVRIIYVRHYKSTGDKIYRVPIKEASAPHKDRTRGAKFSTHVIAMVCKVQAIIYSRWYPRYLYILTTSIFLSPYDIEVSKLSIFWKNITLVLLELTNRWFKQQ